METFNKIEARMRNIKINPVLEMEMKAIARRKSTPFVLVSYLLFLFILVLSWSVAANQQNLFPPDAVKLLYAKFMRLQTWIAFFVIPVQSSLSITREKEMQTLDLLLSTRFSAARIVRGKMLSSIAFFLLLFCSSLPFVGISFLIGGIEISVVLSDIFKVFFVTLFISSVGVYFSSVFRRSVVALLLTYVTSAFWLNLFLNIFTLVSYPIIPNAISGAVSTSSWIVQLFGLCFWMTVPVVLWIYSSRRIDPFAKLANWKETRKQLVESL